MTSLATYLQHLLHLQNSSLTLDPSGGNTRHSNLREDTNEREIYRRKERNTNGWKMGNMEARKNCRLKRFDGNAADCENRCRENIFCKWKD